MPSPAAPWTFHIVTFGCKVNQYESQALREAWTGLGGSAVQDPATADVAVVNSCAVTARGERDARNALYRLHRAAPAAQRILTGCSACLAGPALADGPWLDALVPPRAKALLLRGPWNLPPAKGEAALAPDHAVFPFGDAGFHIRAFERARPVLKVQDGCSHRCTYCIVPLVRGPAQSRPLPEILAEATALLEAGHGEIMISGINLHQYGRDARNHTAPSGSPAHTAPHVANIEDAACRDFWQLLQRLDAHLAPRWAGRARLRISSLEPTQLTPRGLDILHRCRMVCPHAHLSLQNGSPRILKRMGRGHCRPERLLDAVGQLRALWPVMGLGADILMGFPGEDEDDLRLTLDVVRELHLSYAHVFPYSVRPGTAAASFDGQVPQAVRLERAASVRAVVGEQQQAFWQSLLTLPELTVALTTASEEGAEEGSEEHTAEEGASPPASPESSSGVRSETGPPPRKGVDAHYAPCRLTATPPAHSITQGMVRVRPLKVDAQGLQVQPLP